MGSITDFRVCYCHNLMSKKALNLEEQGMGEYWQQGMALSD